MTQHERIVKFLISLDRKNKEMIFIELASPRQKSRIQAYIDKHGLPEAKRALVKALSKRDLRKNNKTSRATSLRR